MTPEEKVARAICGLYNIWKPADIVSRKVVDGVAAALGTSRVGHAGTLDPLATGVLVVCAGQAARLVPYVQQQPKTYEAEFLLGCTSDTDDVTGQLTERADVSLPTREQVAAQLPQFLGQTEQVPPKFSAIRVRGRRAHHLARKGRKVEIPARIIEVYRIEILSYEAPKLRLLIECGSGTYVRSIGRDLGERLGCGAVMSSLVRTRIGPFTQANSLPFNQVSRDKLDAHSLSKHWAVSHLPQYECSAHELCEIVQGRKIPCPPDLLPTIADRAEVALIHPRDVLAALVQYRQETGLLHPFLVFAEREDVLAQNGIPLRRSPEESDAGIETEPLPSPVWQL